MRGRKVTRRRKQLWEADEENAAKPSVFDQEERHR